MENPPLSAAPNSPEPQNEIISGSNQAPAAKAGGIKGLLGSPRLDFLLAGPLATKRAASWAALGGLAKALAWPRAGLWPLTWLGPLMLWRAIAGQTPSRAFKLGWFYGIVLGAVSVNWLAEVMSGYGGLGPVGGAIVLLALVAYLALYPGLWGLVTANWTTKTPIPDGRLLVPCLWAAALWTGLDQLKNLLLTGFNWTPLAGGLTSVPALIGAADLFGVYGLTLLVSATSFLLASALLDLRAHPGCALAKFSAAAAIVVFQAGYGHWASAKAETAYEAAPTKKVAVIQPSTPQDQKWDVDFRAATLGRISSLLAQAEAESPWLALWPETSAPFLHGIDPAETAWLDGEIRKAASKGVNMLVGVAALDYDEDGYQLIKNRAWLVGPDGTLGGYDKTHLVPFGEYIPLADVLPFMKWAFMQGVFGAIGNYSPGPRRANLSLDGVPFGVLICFESIFPYQARERASNGARFLVVTTNDAWFGQSSAPEQHLWQASMRAVETRLPLLRAANNGISAHISPSGRVLARSAQNEVAALAWPLGLMEPDKPTFFVRHGYYLAPLCGFLAAARLLSALGAKIRQRAASRKAQKPSKKAERAFKSPKQA